MTADEDYAARSTAPGVFRRHRFEPSEDTPEDVYHFTQHAPTYGTPGIGRRVTGQGVADGSGGYWVMGRSFAPASTGGGNLSPTLDSAIKASGSNSLRWDMPAGSGNLANSPGYFILTFDDVSDGLSFGDEGDEFFIQWRQRFNDAMCSEILDPTTTGIKQLICTTRPLGHYVTPQTVQGSSDFTNVDGTVTRTGDWLWDNIDIEIVPTSFYQRRMSMIYNDSTATNNLWPLDPVHGNSQNPEFLLQNALGPPYCTTYQIFSGHPANYVPPECFGWYPNEWMTFMLGIKLGKRILSGGIKGGYWQGSRVRFWSARENQPPLLLIDVTTTDGTNGTQDNNIHAGGDDRVRYGRISCGPLAYASQPQTKLWQTWMDEFILSTQPVAFPGGYTVDGSTPTPDPTPTTTPTTTPTPTGDNMISFDTVKSAVQAAYDAVNAYVPPVSTPAQTIDTFTVSATSIAAGQSVTVTWATNNATAVRLNGATVAASGSQMFTPAASTSYTLQADGSAATVSQTLSVTVAAQSPSPTADLSTIQPGFARKLGGYFPPDGVTARTQYSCINYNPATREMWLFGGGHNATPDMPCPDNILAFSPGVDTHPWRSLYPVNPLANEVATNPDLDKLGRWIDTNTPTGRHTFNGTLITPDGKYWMLTFAGPVGTVGAICSYDPSVADYTKRWTFSKAGPMPWYYCSGVARDPQTGLFVIYGTDPQASNIAQIWTYDPATDKVTSLGWPALPLLVSFCDLHYIPALDKFVAMKGQEVHEFTYDRANPANTINLFVKYTPSGVAGPQSTNNPSYAWDGARLVGCVTAGVAYVFDPATRMRSSVQLKDEATGANLSVTQDFYCIDSDPVSGCCVMIATDGNTWAFRLP